MKTYIRFPLIAALTALVPGGMGGGGQRP